jgi:hypothetical protein
VPQEALAPVLPPGLELITDVPGSPPGKHVVILTAGMQRGVVPLYAPWWPKMNYQEFMISVPYVRMTNTKSGYSAPFAHPTRIFLTSVGGLIEGRLAGYPKLPASPTITDSGFVLKSWRGKETLITGSYRRYGPTQPPKQFPGFAKVDPILHQPICSTFLGGLLQNFLPGLFIDSYFVWQLDECEMQPAEGEWQVTTDSIPGLPRGTYPFKGYDQDWLGMGWMRAPWRVRAFFPRSAIEEALQKARAGESGG